MIEADKTVILPQQALTQEQLERFLRDNRYVLNDWRWLADREADYYDSKQLDAEILQLMESRGIPPLQRNIIGPTLDTVLGMEAQNRRDLRLVPDEDENEDAVRALNTRFNEAARMCELNKATSDAYKAQVSVGIGWLHVGRELDPFSQPYRTEAPHRREIFYDMRSQRRDLSDARYLVRKRWYDSDTLQVVFPDHADLISYASRSWANFDLDQTTGYPVSTALVTGYSQWTSTSLDAFEWLDTDRERVALYEVWYRLYQRGFVLRYQNTVLEYDDKNPLHLLAVQKGARIGSAILPRIRLAYWLGPHMVLDVPSPYPHNRFPYVAFFGMREDRTGIPYGLIRRMMSPQDEVNARLSRMMWLLSAKRIEADSDAFDMSDEELLDEVSRADAFIKFNPQRMNRGDKPTIKTDHQLATQQFDVMKDAEEYVRASANVHNSFQGKRDPGLESGVAIQTLVEQSAMGLAEINDNYVYGRKQAGELLLSLVKQDLGKDETTVTVRKGNVVFPVTLNKQETNEHGFPYLTNAVSQLKYYLDFEEVPNTVTYKRQAQQQLQEMIRTLPPELQAAVAHIWVKASDLPDKEEMIQAITKATNQGPLSPEAQQQKQQQEAALAEVERRKKEVEIAEKESKIAGNQSQIELNSAQIRQIAAEIANTLVETARLKKTPIEDPNKQAAPAAPASKKLTKKTPSVG